MSLSVPQGAALTIGAVLGTGVISLPALAADIAGPASIVAWVLLVALSVPLAATFAALGSRFPDSGGVSTYVRQAFGGHAATAVGWCFYWSIPVGAPAAALLAGNYVADAVGGGRDTSYLIGGVLIVLVAAMLLLLAMNGLHMVWAVGVALPGLAYAVRQPAVGARVAYQ